MGYFSHSQATQCDLLLRLLSSRPNSWVPLPDVLSLGVAQYNARFKELRGKGHNIQSKTERRGRQVHSWFRLVTSSPAVSSQQATPSTNSTDKSKPRLFPEAPSRHLDLG